MRAEIVDTASVLIFRSLLGARQHILQGALFSHLLTASIFAMQVGPGAADGTDIGPLITADSKSRIEALIASAEQEGARVVLDGRGICVPGHPHGMLHHIEFITTMYYSLDAIWVSVLCIVL